MPTPDTLALDASSDSNASCGNLSCGLFLTCAFSVITEGRKDRKERRVDTHQRETERERYRELETWLGAVYQERPAFPGATSRRIKWVLQRSGSRFCHVDVAMYFLFIYFYPGYSPANKLTLLHCNNNITKANYFLLNPLNLHRTARYVRYLCFDRSVPALRGLSDLPRVSPAFHWGQLGLDLASSPPWCMSSIDHGRTDGWMDGFICTYVRKEALFLITPHHK